jgi:nucleotide-binding universal stress UspA family protein
LSTGQRKDRGLCGADLIVPGVDRIPGNKLNFGSVAQAVLTKSRGSVLLVADGETAQKG